MAKKRANGEGSVYEAFENGRTIIVAALSRRAFINDEFVRKVIKKKGFKSKADGRKWCAANAHLLDEWEAEMRGEKIPLKIKPEDYTFRMVWEMYERDHISELSSKVQKQYNHQRELCASLDNYKFLEITQPMFQDVINSSGATYNIRKKTKTVLSGMGSYVVSLGWTRENLARYCKLPKEPIAEKKLFTTSEIKTLWDFYNGKIHLSLKSPGKFGNLTEEEYRGTAAGLLIMIYSLMRPGELRNIKSEDIDYENHKITKGGIKTKRGKTGSIFFTTSSEPLVRKYLGGSENCYAKKGPEAFRHQCDSLFEKLGMERHKLSACRTTSATTLAESGVPANELKTILRHKDESVTRKYYDKSGDSLAQMALEKMDEDLLETPSQRIEKYEKELKELMEKIAAEKIKIEQK